MVAAAALSAWNEQQTTRKDQAFSTISNTSRAPVVCTGCRGHTLSGGGTAQDGRRVHTLARERLGGHLSSTGRHSSCRRINARREPSNRRANSCALDGCRRQKWRVHWWGGGAQRSHGAMAAGMRWASTEEGKTVAPPLSTFETALPSASRSARKGRLRTTGGRSRRSEFAVDCRRLDAGVREGRSPPLKQPPRQINATDRSALLSPPPPR